MTEAPAIPGVTLGRRLAVGGMGELFLAERLVAGAPETVVVKRLLPGAGDAERLLFAREARALEAALGRGGDTGIVRVLATGPDWIVLEHVDGVDLQTLLDARRKRGRPLPLAVVLHVARGLLRGLATLDALGIVHRDVHPGNVLLSRDGAVKLADLGVVAFSAEAGPTVAGLKGTLAYMAPEQLRDGRADHRSDLYAAGLVVWEALTGGFARPVGAVGLAELLSARDRPLMPPSTIRPDAGALDAVALLPLAPDPNERPSSAAVWCDALLAAGAAAGIVPDANGLAALVEPLVAATPAPRIATRTLGRAVTTASPSTQPTPSATTPLRARSRIWPWVVAVLAGAAALALIWLVTRPPAEPAFEAGAPGFALAAWVAPTSPVIAPSAPEVTDTSIHYIEVAEAERDAAADADVVVPTADVPRTRDAVGSRIEALTPRPERVRVRSLAGILHLAGGGVRGLASRHPGWVLADGEHVQVRMTGGDPAFIVSLRVQVKRGRASFALASDDPAEAACGARMGPLPISGLAVPLTCRVTSSRGGVIAFEVEAVDATP